MNTSFDLIDEPFVPCTRPDGTPHECGLRDVLVNAHDLVELRHPSPLVTIALHRLLLAILHRSYAGPGKTAERVPIYRAGRFDADRIDAYLTRWRDRFDLFSADRPFYQTPGFSTTEPSGINRLAQELSRGNNAALFDHTTDDPPPGLTPAETARVVIAEQAFAVGGGKSDTGNTTHATLVSGAVASEALSKAAWVTASTRLTGGTGTAPDKVRVQNLIDSFAPGRLYWSRLERPYREFLVALAQPGADRESLIVKWFFGDVCGGARGAFRQTLGRVEGGRNYKAAAVGGRVLDGLLDNVRRADNLTDTRVKEVPRDQF